jgi:hypothetical protein
MKTMRVAPFADYSHIDYRRSTPSSGKGLELGRPARGSVARHVHRFTGNQEDPMADDRNPDDGDAMLDPEDVNSFPTTSSNARKAESRDSIRERSRSGEQADSDPNDEVPVPIAMSPAEVDERAQAVEALRRTDGSLPAGDQELEP